MITIGNLTYLQSSIAAPVKLTSLALADVLRDQAPGDVVDLSHMFTVDRILRLILNAYVLYDIANGQILRSTLRFH